MLYFIHASALLGSLLPLAGHSECISSQLSGTTNMKSGSELLLMRVANGSFGPAGTVDGAATGTLFWQAAVVRVEA
jgi:hypothetical protein